MRLLRLAFLATLAACGTASGNMDGPNINKMNDEPPPPEIQSNDILARDAKTNHATVQHILVAWRDLEDTYKGAMDPRASRRSREDADDLAETLLNRARKGDDFGELMIEYSEDMASADGGTYDVTPDAKLVPEFKRLGLRLEVDEVGLVLTQFGWHVIKRVE